jgi:pyruvate kinase
MFDTSQFEPHGRVHTKIVATLGPASRSEQTVRRLIEAGVDVFRLNFSHGTHDDHSETLERIRRIAEQAGRNVAVLQDLAGPKIRLGTIPGDEVSCVLGDAFELVSERTRREDSHQFTCTYPQIVQDLKPGDDVLFADGNVAMRVVNSEGGRVTMSVTLAGVLKSRQGINLPGAALNVKALTDKDLLDLDWTAEHPVEYVGLSFVRHASDVTRLREELESRGISAKIVAKIEKPQAVENLDAILEETDAVMVARGDLGVEMDVARVPAVQKTIIAACARARVPVITATQMLNSMENSTRPTRAEASDVFNAVLDGTDAVMLSGETAIGQYPVEAVAMMSRIAGEAEKLLPAGRVELGPANRAGILTPITEGIVEAASLACRTLKAALLVVATHSGRTALALSKHRHATPTLALTDDAARARELALFWGVTPVHLPDITEGEPAMRFALEWAGARGILKTGDRVVLLRGTVPGSTVHNAMFVQEVE